MLENKVLMSTIRKVVFLVFLCATCCIAILCAHMQLKKRYTDLESRRENVSNVLKILSDPEAGSKLKMALNSKLEQLKKAKKEIHKISKSGTAGIKQAVQKKMAGKPKREKVAMEEFEVEIGEI